MWEIEQVALKVVRLDLTPVGERGYQLVELKGGLKETKTVDLWEIGWVGLLVGLWDNDTVALSVDKMGMQSVAEMADLMDFPLVG